MNERGLANLKRRKKRAFLESDECTLKVDLLKTQRATRKKEKEIQRKQIGGKKKR